jgi:hypothetical protein
MCAVCTWASAVLDGDHGSGGAPTLSWIARRTSTMPERRYATPPGLAYRTTDVMPLVWEAVENAWNRNLDGTDVSEQ